MPEGDKTIDSPQPGRGEHQVNAMPQAVAAPSHPPAATGPHSRWQHFKAEMPFGFGLVVFLTACTLILHSWTVPALDRLEHGFVSQVVARALAQQRSAQDGPAGDVERREVGPRDGFRIQQIELSGEFRALALEEPDPDAATVRRLDGVRPLSRAAMAALLQQLAECIRPGGLCPSTMSDRAQRPQVLALDVDLAPLRPCTGPGDAECRAVRDALDALRQQVHVVVIALKRPEREANDLVAAFMRDSHCTRAAPSDSRKGLYFASPLLFERSHQGPLRFPATFGHGTHARWFPGLGTLTWMASQPKPLPREQVETLTSLCEAAYRSTPALEHAIDGGLLVSDAGADHAYTWRYLNWLAMEDERSLEFTPVGLPDSALGPDSGRCAPGLARQACLDHFVDTLRKFGLGAGTLLLSVDAGGTNDKFTSPGLRAAPVSGAMVHAVQALSVGRNLADARAWGIAADVALGALMMMALAALKLWALEPLRHRLPYVGALLSTAAVLGVTALFSALAVDISARMLRSDLWFNPLFVMIGLALHALIEGWLPEPQAAQGPWARLDRRLLKACLLLAVLGAVLATTLLH